jgi:hypothetical protein
MKNLDSVSGIEMQQLIVNTMKELAWVVWGEVLRTQKEKDELVIQANQLIEKFQRDFTVN